MKIIKSKKYSQEFGDPYKVDFNREEGKASKMSTDSLFGALKDAFDASQVSVNEGKYFDQLSVYRKELINRGISIFEQNKRLKETPSAHTDPFQRKLI